MVLQPLSPRMMTGRMNRRIFMGISLVSRTLFSRFHASQKLGLPEALFYFKTDKFSECFSKAFIPKNNNTVNLPVE
jgi:hypothetical protein